MPQLSEINAVVIHPNHLRNKFIKPGCSTGHFGIACLHSSGFSECWQPGGSFCGLTGISSSRMHISDKLLEIRKYIYQFYSGSAVGCAKSRNYENTPISWSVKRKMKKELSLHVGAARAINNKIFIPVSESTAPHNSRAGRFGLHLTAGCRKPIRGTQNDFPVLQGGCLEYCRPF